MTTIGVTGPTGAGKTTVLNALADLGCVCVDCDALYHTLLDASPQLLGELTDRFGKSILNSCGRLERKALGALVFDHPAALADLNAISHRHIMARCLDLADQARASGRRGIVFDAIALLESGLAQRCDVTVAVVAPPELRLRRIMVRDGIDGEYARKRVAAQKPNEYYVNLCDYTIVNDGSKSPSQLAREVRDLFEPILC